MMINVGSIKMLLVEHHYGKNQVNLVLFMYDLWAFKLNC